MHIAINNSKLDISNIDTTKKLAEDFVNRLKKGSFVFLYGEIGVGKTTFVKHFINTYQIYKNLEISEVTSPTFSLMNEYEIGEVVIKHYDLYRLKSKSEIKNLDLFDVDKNTITFIEWPELVDKKKILNNVDLIFSYENNHDNRFIKISGLT
ncbi:MAG: tRNA (adenosine(37)-N6)-threonylcarbamoyltransferase complex ATPase subunit type 1 TsaE [Pelagibacteraceae bacterium TMED267]|nr:MAG: tRNA (adenosine(37)-N6)-threonylcarbamoyltransferase complex ATPase subunit type 1 TsaE [Pelagibacteraceae bacterium TMED267]|tara:strand:+ start:914 stop:1369 length:456 start_codon:yes stop_codon:yes gene_type:complete